MKNVLSILKWSHKKQRQYFKVREERKSLACRDFYADLYMQTLAEFGGFPYDSSKVAEFEFYLLEELEFYLIVWHPYRSLTQICNELGMRESGLQYAWFIVNDSYRTDVCLLYPPHLIALAAVYLTVVLNHADFAPGSAGDQRDMKQWFADLNVDIKSVIEISQEILSIYEVWADWKEEKMLSLYKELKKK